MRINWKRFTFGAFLLASFSLFLFGCSEYGGTPTTQTAPVAKKPIIGVVSDPGTGLPLANATVTAYAINDAGDRQRTLSVPATTQSDTTGAYILFIPKDYVGPVVVEATLPAASTAKTAGALKQVSAAPAKITTIRTVLSISAPQQPTPPAMLSLATEMLVQYVQANNAAQGGFTAENVLKATSVLENYFGTNFTQTPPPASGSTITSGQATLTVMITAFNTVINTSAAPTAQTAIATLVTATTNSATGHSTLSNIVAVSSQITQAYTAAVQSLTTANVTLPVSYTAPAVSATPIDLSDTTPPSAPGNPIATPTTNTVALSWTASADDVGVTAYLVYRGSDTTPLASIPTPATNYTDTTVTASTTYTYVVKARDLAGNLSTGSTISVTTATPVFTTYTISGQVNLNGSGLAGVPVAITGAGSGSAITDASGNYSFTGVLAGNYTLTPSLAGYAFSPASSQVSVSGTNVTGTDFTATLDGSVTGGVTYPPGTIIGGVSYPSGTVINGVTYPTATVIGGVTYPTGTVIGGVTYPTGVVIGGVTYPPGTVVGGVAFPVGVATTGIIYPTGTVIGGATYPTGTVTGGVIYPAGTAIGSVTYPTGAVIGGVTYPAGTVTGSITLPNGSVTGAVASPNGSLATAIVFQ